MQRVLKYLQGFHYQKILKEQFLIMKSIRNDYGIIGPIPLDELPQSIKDQFKKNYDLEHELSEDFISNTTPSLRGQVPRCFTPKYDDLLLKHTWTSEMIETGVLSSKNRIKHLTPPHYPHSCEQILDALSNVDTIYKSSNILVHGSVSPWVECLLISQGYKNIFTTDYIDINIKYPGIVFIPREKIFDYKFDLVISYSSLEHDGLGRYGDPINPRGAFDAVDEVYELLNEKGVFLCAIPIRNMQSSFIAGNRHILFGEKTTQKLFSDFDHRATIPVPSLPNEDLADWQEQPIFVLVK